MSDAPKRQTQVAEELECLEEAIAETKEVFDALVVAIRPVLSVEEESSSTANEETEHTAPLAQRLQVCRLDVQALKSAIITARDHVEV